MKNSFYTILLLILLNFAATASAQQPEKGQTSVRFENGMTIVFTSETDPPNGSNRQMIGSVQTGGDKNVIHRALIDTQRGVYFGYDLTVEPAEEAGKLKLSFHPLSISPRLAGVEQTRLRAAAAESAGIGSSRRQQNTLQPAQLTALPLPKYPESQIVSDGDTLALDVLINQQTKVKIVDLIKVTSSGDQFIAPLSTVNQRVQAVSAKNQQLQAVSVAGTGATGAGGNPASDFTIDAVELKVASSRLLINGQTVIGGEKGASRAGVTGALIWFYLPERGRFILSLAPREGYDFQKTGTVQGNRISFFAGGEQYEWISNSPVVSTGSRAWNLWVLHDPAYRPDFNLTEENPYQFGAADRIEYLLKKK